MAINPPNPQPAPTPAPQPTPAGGGCVRRFLWLLLAIACALVLAFWWQTPQVQGSIANYNNWVASFGKSQQTPPTATPETAAPKAQQVVSITASSANLRVSPPCGQVMGKGMTNVEYPVLGKALVGPDLWLLLSTKSGEYWVKATLTDSTPTKMGFVDLVNVEQVPCQNGQLPGLGGDDVP